MISLFLWGWVWSLRAVFCRTHASAFWKRKISWTWDFVLELPHQQILSWAEMWKGLGNIWLFSILHLHSQCSFNIRDSHRAIKCPTSSLRYVLSAILIRERHGRLQAQRCAFFNRGPKRDRFVVTFFLWGCDSIIGIRGSQLWQTCFSLWIHTTIDIKLLPLPPSAPLPQHHHNSRLIPLFFSSIPSFLHYYMSHWASTKLCPHSCSPLFSYRVLDDRKAEPWLFASWLLAKNRYWREIRG